MIGNHVDGYRCLKGSNPLLSVLNLGPLVKWLRHRPFTAVTRVRIPYGSFLLLEDYPSPAEGNGLENRQAGKTVQGFESLILLNCLFCCEQKNYSPLITVK